VAQQQAGAQPRGEAWRAVEHKVLKCDENAECGAISFPSPPPPGRGCPQHEPAVLGTAGTPRATARSAAPLGALGRYDRIKPRGASWQSQPCPLPFPRRAVPWRPPAFLLRGRSCPRMCPFTRPAHRGVALQTSSCNTPFLLVR
jgi:hypothetical protein